MQTNKYTRKPLTVEAVQVTDENMYEVAEWCDGEVRKLRDGRKWIKLHVLHPTKPSHSEADPGDWILKSDIGYKIFSDAAFVNGWDISLPGTVTLTNVPSPLLVETKSGEVLAFAPLQNADADTLKFQHEMSQVPAGEDS